MIIYGTRMYFRGNVVKSFAVCDHCGRYSRMTSYQATKFGHIYFIPLLPLGSKNQVLRECKSCEMGSHIPVTNLEPVVDRVQQRFRSWIELVQEGQRELEDDGEKYNIGQLISGILDDLYCLKQIENADSILTILKSQDMDYEAELVQARWHLLVGNLDLAKASYYEAGKLRPEDGMAYYQAGKIEVIQGNVQGSEAAFEKYLAIHPNEISAYVELAGLYERNKDYPKLIKCYDVLYTLNSSLISNAGMKKLYKTACKKSGIQGKFIEQMK
jgi:tetratricopeptide (TPR) repeat protein